MCSFGNKSTPARSNEYRKIITQKEKSVRILTKSVATMIILGGIALPCFLEAEKTVFLSSMRYLVDVSLDVTGKCDPYEGATFSALSFVTKFDDVRFGAPQSESHAVWFYLPVEGSAGTRVPGIQISGEGAFLDYKICPAWDDDKPTEAKVVKGPSKFEPTLEVISEGEIRDTASSETILPLVITAWFKFFTSFSVLGDELAWQHGNIGGAGIENYAFVFGVPVDVLAQGKQFSHKETIKNGAETQNWSVMFIPLDEE